jgi:hypothetical protein
MSLCEEHVAPFQISSVENRVFGMAGRGKFKSLRDEASNRCE